MMVAPNNLLNTDPVTPHNHVARFAHYATWQHVATGPVSKALYERKDNAQICSIYNVSIDGWMCNQDVRSVAAFKTELFCAGAGFIQDRDQRDARYKMGFRAEKRNI